jgi:hypothetical protein
MEPQRPKSIEEAVEVLLSELSEKDRQAIRIMAEQELSSLHLSLGNHIRNGFGLWENNEELLSACCPDGSLRNADDASTDHKGVMVETSARSVSGGNFG